MNILTPIRARVYIFIENLLLDLLKSLRSRRSIFRKHEKDVKHSINLPGTYDETDDLSIIITTFEARFFEFTIPLITALRTEINLPIFVIINGNYTKNTSNLRLQEFIIQLGKFSNIYPAAFSNFHGCAELWNTGIVNADSKYFLILNDDVHVYPNLLRNRLLLIRELIKEKGLITINRSFSHFGISQKCIEEVGFFDEHFIGIGEEDRDYFYRYEAKYLIAPYDFSTDIFYNFGDESRDNSVEKNEDGKYSFFNTIIREEFYSSEQEGTIRGRYEFPVKRLNKFLDPRPLWKFRRINYQRLQNRDLPVAD
jgi:hypothetical protein